MNGLIPWRRTTDLSSLFRHEMGDLFGRFFVPGFFGPGEEGNGSTNVWTPPVDVAETNKEIVITAELPGVDPKAMEIYVANGALVLKGEKEVAKEEKAKNYYRTERYLGTFYREVPLPAGVDADKITATCAHGVLAITIPKKPEALPKKVAVKAIV